MKYRPLYDRRVVKRIDAENKTASGLIIPDAAKEKPSEAEVVAVGNGLSRLPCLRMDHGHSTSHFTTQIYTKHRKTYKNIEK